MHNLGRPLSVMKVLHAPQQGQGEARLKKHINIHRNFPDIGREYVNEATKQWSIHQLIDIANATAIGICLAPVVSIQGKFSQWIATINGQMLTGAVAQ